MDEEVLGFKAQIFVHPLTSARVMATTAWIGGAIHRPQATDQHTVADRPSITNRTACVRDVRGARLGRSAKPRLGHRCVAKSAESPPSSWREQRAHCAVGPTWTTTWRPHCAQKPGAPSIRAAVGVTRIRSSPVYTLYTPARPARCFSHDFHHLQAGVECSVARRSSSRSASAGRPRWSVVADDHGVDAAQDAAWRRGHPG